MPTGSGIPPAIRWILEFGYAKQRPIAEVGTGHHTPEQLPSLCSNQPMISA